MTVALVDLAVRALLVAALASLRVVFHVLAFHVRVPVVLWALDQASLPSDVSFS